MKKVLEYLKKTNRWEIAYSILLALMLVLDRHVINMDASTSTLATTSISTVSIIDLPLLVILAVVAYLLVQLIKYLIVKVTPLIYDKPRTNNTWWIGVILFVFIAICWIPYIMSYWPGGIYNDTLDSIHIALHKEPMNNQNTVLYALLWRLAFAVGNIFGQGEYGGLKVFTAMSMICLAALFASFIACLYKRGVRLFMVCLMTLAVAIIPIFPYYGISLWKDTTFGIVMFLYSWMLYSVINPIGEKTDTDKMKISTHMLIRFTILSLLVAFLRNNGVYVIVFVSICILIFLRNNKDLFKKMLLTCVSVILVTVVIQGPVFSALGYNTTGMVECMGIPLQQTGYILATEGNISVEDEEVLQSIMDIETWKYLYNPIVADSIKFSEFFDREYYNSHVGDFLKTYVHICIKNPVKAVKGYLLATLGFWDATESSSSAYICKDHTAQSEYFMSDYVDYYFDKSWDSVVSPRHYISAGLIAWIMLGALMIIMGKDKRKAIAVLPGFALWLTIMIAVPLAFSFRYIFPVFICIPLYLMSVSGVLNKKTG